MASVHPVPKHVKELRGTTRADRKATNPVVYSELNALPDCPDYLVPDKRTSLGRDIVDFWNNLLLDIHRLDLLTKIAMPQIEDYVLNYRIWRQEVENLNNEGAVVEYTNENKGLSAHYKAIREARKAMQVMEDRWGFNPSYQQKINWPQKEEKKENKFGL